MIVELADKSPINTAKLWKFMKKQAGWQPLEKLYPDLHQANIYLVTGAGADSHRQIDVLNLCKTLDDLDAALQNKVSMVETLIICYG